MKEETSRSVFWEPIWYCEPRPMQDDLVTREELEEVRTELEQVQEELSDREAEIEKLQLSVQTLKLQSETNRIVEIVVLEHLLPTASLAVRRTVQQHLNRAFPHLEIRQRQEEDRQDAHLLP